MPGENKSREIVSNQQGIHENLEKVVRKHFNTEYRKPIAEHTRLAFEQLSKDIANDIKIGTPLLFDSFCGTGRSTKILARANPETLVVGIDRSIARLSKVKQHPLPSNMHLIQAECADFWLLAIKAGWQLKKHSIYYPNPYPKATHLKRRWHAHAAYPLLFKLGGEIEVRTNWKIYAHEFAQAFQIAVDYLPSNKLVSKGVETLSINNSLTDDERFMTLFEKKYYLAGQTLYRCRLVY